MKYYRKLSEIQHDLSRNLISCTGLIEHYLRRIKETSALNAFLETYDDEALEEARILDEKLKNGTAGPLAGLVIGLKDNICYKNHKVSASSKILEGFTSLFSATVVERLKAADAIIIGRCNCDEFAMGSSNENSAFGPVLNPLDLNKVPGGSSGGTVAAVKAGLCHAALGSDTGGSIRQPASFCDLTGFKPTYSTVSRWGLIAYASSFDQIGPITHSAEDAEIIYKTICGTDERDNTTSRKFEFIPPNESKNPLKIGYIKETFEMPGLDPEILHRMQEILDGLKAEGHSVEPVSFPYLDYLVPTYYVLTTAEASSNLSRFDGIRFGYRSPKAKTIDEVYTFSRSEGFGREVKRRIMLGTFVLSAGYYDAYYTKGQQVRQKIRNATDALLQDYDFLMSPTTPTPPFQLGAKSKDPISMYLSDIFTVHANITGHPAVSIPAGQHSNGLPFGIQALGNLFEDAKLLQFAKNIEEKYRTFEPALQV